MSHFTHVCPCGHDRENHMKHAPNFCMTSDVRIKGCGCSGGVFTAPPVLRETFTPAWIDGHRMGEHHVTPVVQPGALINPGSGAIPTCGCAQCTSAFAEVTA